MLEIEITVACSSCPNAKHCRLDSLRLRASKPPDPVQRHKEVREKGKKVQSSGINTSYSFTSKDICVIGLSFPSFSATDCILFSMLKAKKLVEIQRETGDTALSISARQQLLSGELLVPTDTSLTLPMLAPRLSCTISGTCVAHRDLSCALLPPWVSAAQKWRRAVPGILNSQAPTEAASSRSRHPREEQQQYPSQAQEGGLIDSERQRDKRLKWMLSR